jgi:membrane fusion protein (multidrug efflux system)
MNPQSLSPSRRTRLRPIAPSFAAALLAIASVAACKKPANVEAPPPVVEEAPIKVSTTKVDEKPMPRWLQLTGTLTANESADVAADVAGKVLDTTVDRGSLVKKGDVLAKTDARTASLAAAEADAQLKVARAQAEQVKIDCDRYEALYKAGALAGAEYERQHASCNVANLFVSSAETHVASASKGLVDSNIRAPFAGLIAVRYISIGEYVLASTKVVKLMQIDPLRLELSVPESSAPLMNQGLAVEFTLSAFPGETFKGSVRYVGPELRTSSRDLLVEAVVANADQRLRPGMFSLSRIDLGEKPSLVVPKAAIRDDGTNRHVFVVVNGKIEDRLVQLGEEKGDLVGIDDGLKKGEVVVSPLTPEVRDGAKVK